MKITEQEADKKYIGAVAYTLKKGLNFTEISVGYGHGNALKLFAKGLEESSVKRKDVFLTNALYTRDLPNLKVVNQDISTFYETLGTDYADSTLVTQSFVGKFGKEDSYKLLHELLETKKTRYVSISNAGPILIKEFKEEFGDKVFAHEGHISFEVRALQDKGIFDLCKELGITNIIWRPIHRNNTTTRNWPLLVELAKKYQKTQNQIVLNWVCSLGYYPMVMSANKKHIDENVASTDFEMSKEDYKRITDFRPQNYIPHEIDWEKIEIDDSIVALVTDFDKHIKL